MKPRKTLIVTPYPDRVQGSNHLAALLAATRERPLTPGVYHVLVQHDSWCALLADHGACDCQPDIEIREAR